MNYTEMSLVELKKIAKELGIKGVSSMKKNELAELLTAVKERQQEGKKQAASVDMQEPFVTPSCRRCQAAAFVCFR